MDERAGCPAPGPTLVVFENGGRAPIEAWAEVPARIAELAPVIAYDRSTVGASEWVVATVGLTAAALVVNLAETRRRSS